MMLYHSFCKRFEHEFTITNSLGCDSHVGILFLHNLISYLSFIIALVHTLKLCWVYQSTADSLPTQCSKALSGNLTMIQFVKQ